VLLGVDGTAHGVRQRVRFFGRNAGVPLMIISVGAGATALRGIWGYHGDHPPHGDRLLAVRRRVPVLTVVVDTPAKIRSWFEIVDELTDQPGLVTCEMVPAFRAGERRGGLRLSSLPVGEAGGRAR
jgi:PII-like signaling protein